VFPVFPFLDARKAEFSVLFGVVDALKKALLPLLSLPPKSNIALYHPLRGVL
jgi:hypothetical protein